MNGGFSFGVVAGWVLGGATLLLSLGCGATASQPVSVLPDTVAPSTASPSASSVAEDRPGEAPSQTAEEVASTNKAVPSEAPRASQPQPGFFEGREKVSYGEFVLELRKIADELQADPDVRAAHRELLEAKNLSADELPLESFSRVRLAFESARDSGLWGIRGTVTDQMPWSDRIWAQWKTRSFLPDAPVAASASPAFPSAVGECDELGALFSILARDLGVVGFVGLHWPYWNHVVPVWQVNREDGTFVRIVVPATQTFLDKRDTIGTTGLPTNRVVFPYVRKDQREETEIAADLARFLLTQSQLHGGMSTSELTERRLLHRWTHRPQTLEKPIEGQSSPSTAAAASTAHAPSAAAATQK